MQSNAKDVTTYIQEAPAERQAALVRLRDLCRAELTDFEESMQYGLPSDTAMVRWIMALIRVGITPQASPSQMVYQLPTRFG